MKYKPQMIKTSIDSIFIKSYTRMLIPAVKRKFDIEIGIEPEMFIEAGGMAEMLILFIATDEDAEQVYDYITSKWQFINEPVLVA